ncbi:acyl-CoA dehydrogenase family protein [Govanella unica]|uniref:Acyl-CoA dehydrogenase family protein n=1 Tax=Govanella unica TaxID=2975056 RepID=A0A9X3TZW2_9PROT|nr:acyl-CoA dehydrogenase family protein [Govania unica]MDA5194800.1 acyl-CoA dehydrogenase family protein [Govania unica]
MTPRDPMTELPTHDVTNQPPIFDGINLYALDLALQEALLREGGTAVVDKTESLGAIMGRADTFEAADNANRHKPELQSFDRYGRRIDAVSFHPAYHQLMALAVGFEIPSIAWTAPEGGHVAHTALEYLFAQVEGGACCPVTMTYAAVPALRLQPDLARDWEAKILTPQYDPRPLPMAEKDSVTIGMAMTEKQGGSDVRANTTRATPLAESGWYSLKGHKWFCSAPMSDAFLTLAQTGKGLSCFFVPRWTPDGRRNPFFIQRLKNKLGNWSNASAEIEYDGTRAALVGEEGRGVATILEMVHHTRLDTAMAAVALMRQALTQALYHTRHRMAFQKKLIDQPLMSMVLTDLALEVEAAVALLFRVARAYDDSARDPQAAKFARLAVAVAKYHLNKRAPGFVYEAMECLGGIGYVEESIMARLYREAPLNSIWEGSGNVICLDVLRTVEKDPETLELYFAELERVKGQAPALDRAVAELRDDWRDREGLDLRARHLAEKMAVCLEAALLLDHAPTVVSDGFLQSRMSGGRGRAYGSLPSSIDRAAILARAWPLA